MRPIFLALVLTALAPAAMAQSQLNTVLANKPQSSPSGLMQSFAKCDPAAAKLHKAPVSFGAFKVMKAKAEETKQTYSVTYTLNDQANLDKVRELFKGETGADIFSMESSKAKGSVSFETNEDGAVTITCIRRK